jgi:hypothetical protein
MRILARYALSIGAVTVFAGCVGLQTPIGAPGVMPQAVTTAAHADRGTPWMLPEAKRDGLLYVADITMDEVWVFSYPQGRFVGDLTGSAWPEGECVDKFGDIFITDYADAKILEYSHGATQPLKTVNDSGYLPTTCSVDPITGDLAVTNYKPKDRMGSVAIYEEAVYKRSPGKPRRFSDPAIQAFASCTYDDKGDLFVDGPGSGSVELAELPRGSGKFRSITLAKSIKTIGPLQWDGAHITMGGHRGSLRNARQIIQRLEISGSHAKSVGSTQLDNVVLGGAYFIDSTRVVTPDADKPRVQIFAYPEGGNNLDVIKRRFGEPVAVVISHPTR